MGNPLHHIECWTGRYFQQASLGEVGAYILVRHDASAPGTPLCATLTFQREALEHIQCAEDAAEQAALEHATGRNHPAPPPSRGLQSTLSNEEEAQEGDDDLVAIDGYLNGPTDASANALAGSAAANISASPSHKCHDAL